MSSNRQAASGLSLIELMIALAVGLLLLLGLVQVFAASRTAYQLSEGIARVQENGRFAMDYLQRDLRMAGHNGCVNDQSRLLPQGVADPFLSHLNNASGIFDGRINFGQSLQGYEAVGTAPGDSWNVTSGTGTWSPALPGFLSGLPNPPLPGSDVVVLRFFSGEGLPVQTITSVTGTTTITVAPAAWATMTADGVANPSLFAVADCSYADVFQAATAAAGTVVFKTSTGLNSSVDFTERYTASPAGQTVLYRAESVAYYVARGANGEPSLFRLRFNPAPGGGLASGQPAEELVQGIENLQFLYGRDANPVSTLNGNISQRNVATALGTLETNWRRVGLVQVGILSRSPTPAGTSPAAAAVQAPSTLGVSFSPEPSDSRYRTTYETTVAARNRLYGN